MTITLRGAVLVASAIFTFILARLTQVGWLYVLNAFLWGSIILSLMLPWLTVMSLSARRRLVIQEGGDASSGPTEGETVRIELFLENPRRWPRYLLSVSYDCPLVSPGEETQRVFLPRLGRGTSLAYSTTVECYRRGLFHFGPVTMECRAPFGLFRRRKQTPSPLSVLVYPQVHDLNGLALLEGARGPTARPQRRPVGAEISSSRFYHPGDPLRHIHWRNTARLGRPMIKEFEDPQENALVIASDSTIDLGAGRETTLEYSVKLAASVARYVMNRGGRVDLLTGTLSLQEIPWTSLLTELALLEPALGRGLACMLDSVAPGSRLLALVKESDLEALEWIRSRSGRMTETTVVLLGGFHESSPFGICPAKEALEVAGVRVVTCSQGELLRTMRALETPWTVGQASKSVAAGKGR